MKTSRVEELLPMKEAQLIGYLQGLVERSDHLIIDLTTMIMQLQREAVMQGAREVQCTMIDALDLHHYLGTR